jgi:hypothetical protein
MIIGLSLPKPLPDAAQQPVRIASRRAFQRLQQPARVYPWQQQNVDMIGHHHIRLETILIQLLTSPDCLHDQLSDLLDAKIHGTSLGRIEIAIHPNEGLATGDLTRRWIQAMWQTAMQVPRDKEPFVLGVLVRKPTARTLHVTAVRLARRSSLGTQLRREESRRCRLKPNAT